MSEKIRYYDTRKAAKKAVLFIKKGSFVTVKKRIFGTSSVAFLTTSMKALAGRTVKIENVWVTGYKEKFILEMRLYQNTCAWNEDSFVEEFNVTEDLLKDILRIT